jgi:hypothetical protein
MQAKGKQSKKHEAKKAVGYSVKKTGELYYVMTPSQRQIVIGHETKREAKQIADIFNHMKRDEKTVNAIVPENARHELDADGEKCLHCEQSETVIDTDAMCPARTERAKAAKPGRQTPSGRVYVDVSGGVVQCMDGLPKGFVFGVIDWDNIEADPVREWESFDATDRKYIRTRYPEDYRKFFAALDTDSK